MLSSVSLCRTCTILFCFSSAFSLLYSHMQSDDLRSGIDIKSAMKLVPGQKVLDIFCCTLLKLEDNDKTTKLKDMLNHHVKHQQDGKHPKRPLWITGTSPNSRPMFSGQPAGGTEGEELNTFTVYSRMHLYRDNIRLFYSGA